MLALVVCFLCSMSAAAVEAYTEYAAEDSTLTFYYDDLRSTRLGTTYDINIFPTWYSAGISESVAQVVFDPSFADFRPTTTEGWFHSMRNLKSIIGLEYLDTSQVTTMESMFTYCESMTSLDLSTFNTANVEDMTTMFLGCLNLTSLDLTSFNTSSLTNMNAMFWDCRKLTSIDLSSFNTANVTDMSQLFYCCTDLKSVDLSNFNTSNVTKMNEMFYICNSLDSVNLRSFDTSNVRSFFGMFANCRSLKHLDLSNFNTSSLVSLGWMFFECRELISVDLSSFNTDKVTGMDYMFLGDKKLTTVYVGNGWTTAAVTSSSNMFQLCTSIVGGKGTTYDADHLDAAYAHIDGGTSNPGYFTAGKIRGDVDGNGTVDMDDLTKLINYLLTNDATGINLVNAASCDGNDGVGMDDLTALISYLLTNQW